MNGEWRLSTYDTILPLVNDPTRAVAVNGLYGAVDIITAEESRLLEQSGGQAALPSSLREETATRLSLRGHLVRESPAWELENARILSRVHWLIPYRKFVDLVVMPTYNCNFRCEYCFERNRLDRGPEWLNRSMSPQMVDALFDAVAGLQKRGGVVRRVILYGGEPLLRANQALVADLLRRCGEMGIHIAAVTNGYDLDHFLDVFPQEVTDFLQITVDGPAPVHDSRRYLAGGQGTFARIMDNIGKALDHHLHINVRTNVNRANLRDGLSLMDEYRRRGFIGNPYFSFYFKATLGCYEEDPANAITDEDVFQALLGAGVDRKEAIRLSRVHSFMAQFASSALDRTQYPLLKPSFCGAHSDMLVVDPDGTLYACWDMVSMEEHAVGFLDPESKRFLYNFNFAKWRNRTAEQLPDCAQCPLMMVCGGGCAVEAEALHGDRNRGYCGSMKEAFREVIPQLCEERFASTGDLALSNSFYDLFRALTPEERHFLLTSSDSEQVWHLIRRHLTAADKIFA